VIAPERAISVFGVRLARLSPRAALAEAEHLYDAPESSYIAYANVHTLNLASGDDLYRRALEDAAMVLNDGKGVMLAARIKRDRFPADLNGNFFTPLLLALAAKRHPALRFESGDAEDLSYADASFDAATVGFGARNFAQLERGLAELVRVVRPGGRVVVLEITAPQRPPLSWFFRLWFDRAVPTLGRLAGDADAYTYLPSSVRRFPEPAALAAALAAAGLVEVRWILTAGGIIALHSGTVAKP